MHIQNTVSVMRWGSLVSVATMLRAGQFGICILVGVRDLSLHQNAPTGCGAYPSSCSMGTGARLLC
jgi:hypothetical protein